MYDNFLHFTVPQRDPLHAEQLPAIAAPTEVSVTEPPPSTGSPSGPAGLDPELLVLADPEREVLLSVQPSFIQRAPVPLDVAALIAAADVADGGLPDSQLTGLDG
jgi:hypothetical protein